MSGRFSIHFDYAIRRIFVRRALALSMCGLIVLLAGSTASANSSLDGKPAPDLTLFTYKGGPVNLAAFKGKGIVLNFWATWCAPCKQEMPLLNEAYDNYKKDGIVVLGVNLEQEKEMIAPFLEHTPINFPILLDIDGKFSKGYKLVGLPTTFFINRDGTILGSHIGLLTAEIIEEWLAKVTRLAQRG